MANMCDKRSSVDDKARSEVEAARGWAQHLGLAFIEVLNYVFIYLLNYLFCKKKEKLNF